jgi:hypothetical protein
VSHGSTKKDRKTKEFPRNRLDSLREWLLITGVDLLNGDTGTPRGMTTVRIRERNTWSYRRKKYVGVVSCSVGLVVSHVDR